jgi:hypothetical protein
MSDWNKMSVKMLIKKEFSCKMGFSQYFGRKKNIHIMSH